MTQQEEFKEKYGKFAGIDVVFDNYGVPSTGGIQNLISNSMVQAAWWGWKAAKSQAVSQWIPVSERLPENEGTYFCLGHNGTPFVCLFRTTKYEGKIWLRSTGTRRIDGITHWMPLPAAPEQVKGGE